LEGGDYGRENRIENASILITNYGLKVDIPKFLCVFLLWDKTEERLGSG